MAERKLIKLKGDARHIRRDAKARIKENDDLGNSMAADRWTKATTASKVGRGDHGDPRGNPLW